MSISRIPEPGEWFLISDRLVVMVTAVDKEERMVEIQYFDGTIAEMDLDQWSRQSLESIEEPEDWSGPFDELENDDLGFDAIGIQATSWNNPIDRFD